MAHLLDLPRLAWVAPRKLLEVARPDRVAAEVERQLFTTRVLVNTGFLRPMRPDKVARIVWLLQRWGFTPAGAITVSAVRYPHEEAVIDDLGRLTFEELHRRTNALARGLRKEGIGAKDNVAVMARNHRYFIEATVALSKLGANTLYLNTAFASPQIAEVVRREKATAVIYDAEFDGLVSKAKKRRHRYIAWEGDGKVRGKRLESMIQREDQADLAEAPAEPGKVVILTSGTTGAPKGAGRSQPKSLAPAAALLSVIPLKARERTLIAAPLFHSWGFAHFSLGLLLSSTYVLQRRFDPEQTLAAIDRHRPTALVVVPVMLQRVLQLPESVRRKYNTSSLRVIAVSGSALPGELADAVMDEFGDILYNLYGSTEVAWASIATPEDLRAAPGTAGRPPHGTVLRMFDDQGEEVAAGDSGRIFVSNDFLFEGYTGGGTKPSIDGLLSTGDVGHLDQEGRLFVDGRDDEMIVSGGENVFPAEVEDLISQHAGVAEVAVIGVEDPDYGQRLKAFVVPRKGKKPGEAELKAYVKSNLARFKVPREIEFLQELPRNSTGKVLKRDLAEMASAYSVTAGKDGP
jgi:acyl-CoA synthetase (AMP-forming)/AMP-acid ligase II